MTRAVRGFGHTESQREPAEGACGSPAKRARSSLRGRGRPAAAVLSKVATALGTFVLQGLAARQLGAAGLGGFALAYSVVLLIASLSNGLVGDSLTVLDRQRREVRAGLLYWGVLNALGGGLLGAAFLSASLHISPAGAGLFLLASVTFVTESALRRLLQACMQFWSGVLVEGVAALGGVAGAALWAAFARLDLEGFIFALGVGQLAGILTAVTCLPVRERWVSARWPAAMGEVARFGSWRAGQQGIRPGVLTAVRSAITHFGSRAALGHLEAARVYMSPALLAVQGVGTYLFASYARRTNAPTKLLLRRADLAVLFLSAGSLLMASVGTAMLPWFGSIITGGRFSISAFAVFGWGLYAAASAAVTPYQSLAAVRGRQATVTLLRCVDAALSLTACLTCLALGVTASAVPYLLAAGSCIGGVLIRHFVLGSLATTEVTSAEMHRQSSDI